MFSLCRFTVCMLIDRQEAISRLLFPSIISFRTSLSRPDRGGLPREAQTGSSRSAPGVSG